MDEEPINPAEAELAGEEPTDTVPADVEPPDTDVKLDKVEVRGPDETEAGEPDMLDTDDPDETADCELTDCEPTSCETDDPAVEALDDPEEAGPVAGPLEVTTPDDADVAKPDTPVVEQAVNALLNTQSASVHEVTLSAADEPALEIEFKDDELPPPPPVAELPVVEPPIEEPPVAEDEIPDAEALNAVAEPLEPTLLDSGTVVIDALLDCTDGGLVCVEDPGAAVDAGAEIVELDPPG